MLYKGILLERYRIVTGENLIEYIDIMGGQNGRGLIQLSRDGLTKEGTAYIRDEVFPVISRQLLRVLKELASRTYRKAGSGEECSFSDKTEEIFTRLLNPDPAASEESQVHSKQWEWKRMLLGISLFYNFYTREITSERREFTPKSLKEEREEWESTLRKVSSLARRNYFTLKETGNRIQLTDIFLVTEAYIDYKGKNFRIHGTRQLLLADILNSRNKFLVVSRRRTREDKWANALVMLSVGKTPMRETGDAKQMPDLIKDLEDEYGSNRDTDSFREIMENWGDYMLSRFESENLIVRDSDRIQWLMSNVTIHAVFMNGNGNYKIHVLSGSKDKGVFYNRNGKYRLLSAIAERNQRFGGERFAGNTWRGFEYLGIKKYPDDVCCLKEAYMRQNIYYMNFPCTGKAAAAILKFIEAPEESENAQIEDTKVGEIEVPVADWKIQLAEAGDSIYQCLSDLKPEGPQEMKMARNAYREYFAENEERISLGSYVDNLSRSYRFYLQWAWKVWLTSKERPGVQKLNVDEFSDSLKNLKDAATEIKRIRGELLSEAYSNAQYLLNGDWIGAHSHSPAFDTNIEKIFEYAQQWGTLWKYLADIEMEGNFDLIRRKYWENVPERKNLIHWMGEHEGKDEKAVEECYELVWEELKDMAVHRRRQKVRTFMYRHHLASWMEQQ